MTAREKKHAERVVILVDRLRDGEEVNHDVIKDLFDLKQPKVIHNLLRDAQARFAEMDGGYSPPETTEDKPESTIKTKPEPPIETKGKEPDDLKFYDLRLKDPDTGILSKLNVDFQNGMKVFLKLEPVEEKPDPKALHPDFKDVGLTYEQVHKLKAKQALA